MITFYSRLDSEPLTQSRHNRHPPHYGGNMTSQLVRNNWRKHLPRR